MERRPISEEEYRNIRDKMVAEAKQWGHHIESLTCDDCPARWTCEFAGDLYNTNGDCLAEK